MTSIFPLVSPLPGQVLRKFASKEEEEKSSSQGDDYDSQAPEHPEVDIHKADLITSEVEGGKKHKVILDIDFPAQLIPSTTPGHFHLYLDKELSWADYSDLLEVLGDLGIIETGYANASVNRGYSAVRLPWVKKPKSEPKPPKQDKNVLDFLTKKV